MLVSGINWITLTLTFAFIVKPTFGSDISMSEFPVEPDLYEEDIYTEYTSFVAMSAYKDEEDNRTKEEFERVRLELQKAPPPSKNFIRELTEHSSQLRFRRCYKRLLAGKSLREPRKLSDIPFSEVTYTELPGYIVLPIQGSHLRTVGKPELVSGYYQGNPEATKVVEEIFRSPRVSKTDFEMEKIAQGKSIEFTGSRRIVLGTRSDDRFTFRITGKNHLNSFLTVMIEGTGVGRTGNKMKIWSRSETTIYCSMMLDQSLIRFVNKHFTYQNWSELWKKVPDWKAGAHKYEHLKSLLLKEAEGETDKSSIEMSTYTKFGIRFFRFQVGRKEVSVSVVR